MVLALAVILFAVKNLNQVKVNWIVGSGSAPLIIVILITLLVGIVIGHLAGRLSRRKRAEGRQLANQDRQAGGRHVGTVGHLYERLVDALVDPHDAAEDRLAADLALTTVPPTFFVR